nr:hypothetical protein [Anaerolineae bacterium]
MNIIKEFSSSRGSKKSYIVDTVEGYRVMFDAGSDSEQTGWPTLLEDGTIDYGSVSRVPLYVEALVEEAFAEIAHMQHPTLQTTASTPAAPQKKSVATFTEWLLAQHDRRDSVGELARGAAADRRWPRKDKTFDEYKRYLGWGIQSEGLIEAFEQAWEEYQTSLAADRSSQLE